MQHNRYKKLDKIPAFTLDDAISSLSAYYFKDISSSHLIDTLKGRSDFSAFVLAEKMLLKTGLNVALAVNQEISALKVPCCIALHSGKVATILQRSNDTFFLANGDARNGVIEIPFADVAAAYAGRALSVSESLSEVERRLVKPPAEGHWFWREIKAQKTLFRDAVIGSLCANLLAACIALFSLQIYDRVIPHQSTTTLWVLVAGVSIAILVEASLRVARAHLLDASGRQLELRLSQFLFEKYVGGRISRNQLSPGSKVYAIKEFGSVREFFTAASVGSAADIPFAFIFLGLIFLIAGNLAFAVLLAMALIILPSLLTQKKIAQLSEETQGASTVAGKLLIETAYAEDSIKTNQAEQLYKKKWDDIITLNAVKTTQQRVLSAVLTHSAHAIQQGAYVTTIVIGVFMVFAGEFTVGSIIAISILSSRTLAPITQLSSIILRWQQVRASLSMLELIANCEQDRPADRDFLRIPIFKGGFDMEAVQFAYGESPPILNVGKLKISPGEKIAVLGVNGSGKSTLLKVMSGIYDFSQGSFSVDNLDIRQIDPIDIRRNIGYLPQEVKLFAGTLRENLTFGRRQYRDEHILEALAFVGLSHLIQNDPKGLDLLIEDGGVGLSLGQRQSVGLARLFIQDPTVVLLDEPTASLDQNNERTIISNLGRWLEGRTCIVTTHRMQPLDLVDRIIVLQNGKITLDDKRADALKKLGGDVKPAARKDMLDRGTHAAA